MKTLKTTVIIPMAGRGQRFAVEGYKNPKPFINVKGKPMIQRVIEQLDIPNAEFIFICQRSHITYDRLMMLDSLSKNVRICTVDAITQGTAETVLLGTKGIDLAHPIYIINSDQLVSWDHNDLVKNDPDGAIVCFEGDGDNWSYVLLDEADEYAVEVAEKRKISNIATAGVYYWKSGTEFLKYASLMIEKELRVNGEFYVAPVYQEAINDGKRVSISKCTSLTQLGTPAELESYLGNS